MGREPTVDEAAGMAWWILLNETERDEALREAGWRPDGTDAPSVADAWASYKQRSRTAAATRKPLRYVVILNRTGPLYLLDTETKIKTSYPTVAEAERQAIRLNRTIRANDDG